MSDWDLVHLVASEQLAKMHTFMLKKPHDGGEVEIRITVWEYANPGIGNLKFFAQTDLELNQKTAPFRPCGWGNTLTHALSECVRNIRKFEYEEEAGSSPEGAI